MSEKIEYKCQIDWYETVLTIPLIIDIEIESDGNNGTCVSIYDWDIKGYKGKKLPIIRGMILDHLQYGGYKAIHEQIKGSLK